MIEIKKLDFAFQKQIKVLQDINFTLNSGSCLALAGGNGSGKSTLLALLAGLYTPWSGSINVFGSKSPGEQDLLRCKTGLLLQDADLQILGNTVGEDILLGSPGQQAELQEQARHWAGRFNLLKYWQTPVQNLSGGEKKKLCLAACLMQKPSVLLFDEPFNNLDFTALKELRQIITWQRDAGITQIIATHDLEPVLDLVHEVAVLSQGRLVCKDVPELVLDRLEDFGIRTPCSWRLCRSLCAWK